MSEHNPLPLPGAGGPVAPREASPVGGQTLTEWAARPAPGSHPSISTSTWPGCPGGRGAVCGYKRLTHWETRGLNFPSQEQEGARVSAVPRV